MDKYSWNNSGLLVVLILLLVTLGCKIEVSEGRRVISFRCAVNQDCLTICNGCANCQCVNTWCQCVGDWPPPTSTNSSPPTP
uniref:Uncharacterized protein n=1 Tax=Cannabis sativa TaxID=3483 RepID=A0A803RAK6_CANSA